MGSACSLHDPLERDPRVWFVFAVGAGVDRLAEVSPEWWVVFGDARHGVANRSGHARPRSLGRCSRVSGASAEPDCSGQFLDQVLPVALGEADAADIVGPNCVVDVVVDVDQASTVCLAGLIVEVEAGVTTSIGDEAAVDGVAGRNEPARSEVFPVRRQPGRGRGTRDSVRRVAVAGTEGP